MYKQCVLCKYFELIADYVTRIYWKYNVSVQHLVRTATNMNRLKKKNHI